MSHHTLTASVFLVSKLVSLFSLFFISAAILKLLEMLRDSFGIITIYTWYAQKKYILQVEI